jgi:predicted alpha/beta hydrolase family esterase
VGLESDEEKEIAKPWIETPIDLEKVKAVIPQTAAIFSDNDPYVSADNQEAFRDKLDSEIIIKHVKGHFSGEDGITELPIVLEKLLEILGE